MFKYPRGEGRITTGSTNPSASAAQDGEGARAASVVAGLVLLGLVALTEPLDLLRPWWVEVCRDTEEPNDG